MILIHCYYLVSTILVSSRFWVKLQGRRNKKKFERVSTFDMSIMLVHINQKRNCSLLFNSLLKKIKKLERIALKNYCQQAIQTFFLLGLIKKFFLKYFNWRFNFKLLGNDCWKFSVKNNVGFNKFLHISIGGVETGSMYVQYV